MLLYHPDLGQISITFRRNSHRVTARWKNGILALSVPEGISRDEIGRVLEDFIPRLLSSRPTLKYTPDQTLTFPLASFRIARQTHIPDRILGRAALPMSSLEVGSSLDFQNDTTTRAISDMLCRLARRVAPEVLLPHARSIADRLGRHPVEWKVSRGHRILGQCSASGVISLSYVLLFLPEELCDYVIAHEIAHLTELNHSPAFHTLLNSYLGGRERQLVARLRAYTWPVLRS